MKKNVDFLTKTAPLRKKSIDFEVEVNKMITYYKSVRKRTLRLCAPLEIEDYVVQAAPYMSPPRWHVGHTTWFFEMVLKKYQRSYRIYSEDYLYYFNSYYESLGERLDKESRGTKSRPTVKQTLQYRTTIDEKMLAFMKTLKDHSKRTEILQMINTGIEHENQHQELLVYDIKHLLGDLYKPVKQKSLSPTKDVKESFIRFEGNHYLIGKNASINQFAYDNEGACHLAWVLPFEISNRMVTIREYLDFINDGGYEDYRWWHSDAWKLLKTEKWQAPLYYEKEGQKWFIRDFQGYHNPSLSQPVSHVSYYEASAYAKWRGCRLPTEFEWEVAATYGIQKNTPPKKYAFPWQKTSIKSHHANCLENELWQPTPAGTFKEGTSTAGIHQLIGDLWEWTCSDYAPYPGFVSHFEEYNDKWFIHQKVLRGGSWAIPKEHIRSTYRNFFYAHERWMFSGIRLAKTVPFTHS